MNPIAEKLKKGYEARLAGELESCTVKSLGDDRIYWRPLTGMQQKKIQVFAEKSVAEGICMHVKTRALDKNGEAIFKDFPVTSLMNDFEFQTIADIFSEMTGLDLTTDEIEGN
jgi:hypothetical protein